jgi:hypothetical protein
MTSSGLTHYFKNFRNEENSLRVGEAFAELNFGTLSINWEAHDIELAIRDAQGVAKQKTNIRF